MRARALFKHAGKTRLCVSVRTLHRVDFGGGCNIMGVGETRTPENRCFDMLDALACTPVVCAIVVES